MTGGSRARWARQRMIDEDLVARGIRDERVLDAMATVGREWFVTSSYLEHAYLDQPLPIGEGQTISQPYIVAAMLEALELQPSDRLLEVGSGSGYALAVAARLCAEVWGVEHLEHLARVSAQRLRVLGVRNAHVVCADGTHGLAARAPFDAVLVSAAAPTVPDALVDQLAPGGRLVAPVGPYHGPQRLLRLRRGARGLQRDDLGGVAFVPLLPDDPAQASGTTP